MGSPLVNSNTELFPKQLHSRNDLREWNAIFRKGNKQNGATISIKIDPHFLRDSDAFVLSHDEPLPWQHRRNHYDRYSTLDDVLQYFQSPPAFVHGLAIDIALCFKAAPQPLCNNNDVDNNQDAKKWMQIAESFFERAHQVVENVLQQFDIQLSFILDGDAKPCHCLAEKFLPWNSTWIETDECSIDCYYSNAGFCERFSILNDPARSNWTAMSAQGNHYGKFGENKNQALQLWEPDSQQVIYDLMDVYIKGRKRGVPSGSGLKFAINMDVAMFDVFTARVLNGTDQASGFNLLVDDTQNATTPSLIYESPGEMTLYYHMPGNVTSQKQWKRKLSFSPFTKIDVGPPEGSKETDNILQHHLGSDYISPLHSVYNDTYGAHIYNKFGESLVASWSKQDIGEYSFLFVAVEGKVYASTKHGKTDFSDFRMIGLGTSVHASCLVDTLLLVTEGNNCYNSHVHNTQAAPLVCRPQKNPILHACEYSIDYSVGVTENWFRWLQRTQAVITPCNEFILHGALTAGRNPSGALFPLDAKARLEGKVGIMVASETYPLLEESKCGTPFMGESGIIVSAFASTVVMDLDTDSVRYLETAPTTKSDLLIDLMQLKAGIAASFIGCSVCWLFLLWKQKRPRDSYVSIN